MSDYAQKKYWKELGDFNIIRVQIVTGNNQTADIVDMILDMNLFEDMFGVFMSGNILFTDAGSFVEKLPIVGNEKVIIEFQTPGTDTKKKYELYVYNLIREKTTITGTNQVRLLLASLESIANNFGRISKSVKGTHDTIATDLFSETFGALGKTLSTEECLTEIKLNVPTLTCVESLCLLSASAVSKQNGTPSFVFFENTDGFHFKSIESLKSQTPVFEFTQDPTASKMELERNVKKVLSVRYENAPNLITSIASGVYGTQTIYHDPVNKTIDNVTYENDITPTLTKNNTILPKILEGMKGFGATQTYRTVNSNLYDAGEKSVSVTTSEWEGRRKAYLTQMLNSRVIITVTGNSMIDVGDVVKLNINRPEEKATTDKMTTGYYIVSALCNHFDNRGHFMTIELITDGYNSLSGGVQ